MPRLGSRVRISFPAPKSKGTRPGPFFYATSLWNHHLWERAWPAKGRRRRPAKVAPQYPRDFYRSRVRCSVSETRCNGGAFRDRSSHPWPLLVWPSLAKQLPPGTTIAPLTLQRHRHGSEHRPDLSTKPAFCLQASPHNSCFLRGAWQYLPGAVP